MKPIIAILASLFTYCLFLSCDKGPELTPITQEGRNTFSCKVNGKVWVPERTPDLFRPVEAISGGFLKLDGVYDTTNIHIRANRPDGSSIEFHLRSPLLGKHELKFFTSPASIYPQPYGSYTNVDKKTYLTSTENTGSVTLTHSDESTGIISGTFEFKVGANSGETFQITNGRFDINQKTLK